MTNLPTLEPAFAALDDCDAALIKLDKMCCDPGRSPRMKRLAMTLAEARSALTGLANGSSGGPVTVSHLEDAGSQLGSLQVGCCAPSRMPLYARMLENLTDIQRSVASHQGTGH
jgi:hypothetical protein